MSDVGTNHNVGTCRDLSLHYDSKRDICDLYLHYDSTRKITDPSIHDIKIKPLPELIGAYKTTSSKQIHLIRARVGLFPYQSLAGNDPFMTGLSGSKAHMKGLSPISIKLLCHGPGIHSIIQMGRGVREFAKLVIIRPE